MPRKRRDIYSRNCDYCGKFYTSRSTLYCCPKCADTNPPTSEQRFWLQVYIPDLFSCWEWTGSKHEFGYGQMYVDGKTILTHRFSYSINIGVIGDTLCVLHKCHNPSCVNPAHLYLGTTQDNTRDMVTAKRQARGERNGNAKLTEKQVVEIINLLKAGKSQRKIAKLFLVSQHAISEISTGGHWKHIVI